MDVLFVPEPKEINHSSSGVEIKVCPPISSVLYSDEEDLISLFSERIEAIFTCFDCIRFEKEGISNDNMELFHGNHVIFVKLSLIEACDPSFVCFHDEYWMEVIENKEDIRGISVNLKARDATGLWHSISTFEQFLTLSFRQSNYSENDDFISLSIVPTFIHDWSDFAHRSWLLDVSRNRIPRMEELFRIVDSLTRLKYNQLQLYMEASFAYSQHQEVWEHSSPFTPEEIKKLDEYCRSRFIELVPCQNSLAHMHRWLIHERYSNLAEVPDGVFHPFSTMKEPFSLCPTNEDVFHFLGGLYDELLSCFKSKTFNVCLDEAFDVGQGMSSEACKSFGKGAILVGFLHRIIKICQLRGVENLMIWADFLLELTEAELAAVPSDSLVQLIPLIWHYEAGSNWERDCRKLRHFPGAYVCGGTSSWNSIGGRTENVIRNLNEAAQIGVKWKLHGFMVTDWGDWGHLQPPFVSDLAMLVGSANAWNCKSASLLDIPSLLNVHIFKDRANLMGKVAYDLGSCYQLAGPLLPNFASLFLPLIVSGPLHEFPPLLSAAKSKFGGFGQWILSGATGPLLIKLVSRLFGFREEALAHCQLFLELKVKVPLMQVDLNRPDAETVVQSFLWCCRLLIFLCKLAKERQDTGWTKPMNEIPRHLSKVLGDELGPLIEEFSVLWERTSRKGGLSNSKKILEKLFRLLIRKDPNCKTTLSSQGTELEQV